MFAINRNLKKVAFARGTQPLPLLTQEVFKIAPDVEMIAWSTVPRPVVPLTEAETWLLDTVANDNGVWSNDTRPTKTEPIAKQTMKLRMCTCGFYDGDCCCA